MVHSYSSNMQINEIRGEINWPPYVVRSFYAFLCVTVIGAQKVYTGQKIALLTILLFTTSASQFSDEVHYSPIRPSSDIRKFQAFQLPIFKLFFSSKII